MPAKKKKTQPKTVGKKPDWEVTCHHFQRPTPTGWEAVDKTTGQVMGASDEPYDLPEL